MESHSIPGDPLSDEDLRFNVLNHDLVPMHELLSDDEVADMLAHFNIVKEQLPKIKASDAAVRVVDAKPGNVVRITRRSPTAGKSIAYRLVVEAL